MLEIYPVEDKNEQQIMCRICDQVYDPDCMCYAAYVDKILAGICQFIIHGQTGYITGLTKSGEVDDDNALFVMGRAALNFVDLCGAHAAFFNGEVTNEDLVKQIGFSKTSDGKWFMDLNGFFEAPCQHQ